MIIRILIGLVLLVASAYITFTIPITESGIPFTLQSLMVFVIAGILNYKETSLVVIGYLLIGAFGLPVFAEGTSGVEKLLGNSGGFLYGFLFSAFFIANSVERLDQKTFIGLLNIFISATVILFVFGIGHLALKLNFNSAIEYGFRPFWKMALVKAALSAIIVYYFHKLAVQTKN